MIRGLVAIFAVFCAATVLTEALAVALLWHGGHLTLENLRNARSALIGASGQDPSADQETVSAPGMDEVVRERAVRVLELKSRESELGLLKSLVSETATGLGAQKKQLEQQRTEFERRLKELDDEVTAEAAEQARAVLLAMPPDASVEHLMGLSLEQNLLLLKGMPEKSIAKILQAFAGDQPRIDRGRELFEALSRGEPKKNWIDTTIQDVQKTAGQTTSG